MASHGEAVASNRQPSPSSRSTGDRNSPPGSLGRAARSPWCPSAAGDPRGALHSAQCPALAVALPNTCAPSPAIPPHGFPCAFSADHPRSPLGGKVGGLEGARRIRARPTRGGPDWERGNLTRRGGPTGLPYRSSAQSRPARPSQGRPFPRCSNEEGLPPKRCSSWIEECRRICPVALAFIAKSLGAIRESTNQTMGARFVQPRRWAPPCCSGSRTRAPTPGR